MIATESFQNLDGNISIPTSQIVHLKAGKLVTGGGDTITITGTNGGGIIDPGTGGGGGTTPPPATEVQDLTLEYTPLAVDMATNNTILINQDVGQANFSKYEFILTQNEFTLSAGTTTSMAVSKVKMNVNSAGYQICKILMYDENNQLIKFSRTDENTVQLVLNPTTKIDITAVAFTLVTNGTYEISNIFNTDRMPVASSSGWYALTANTDASASFEAVFSNAINVSRVVIYRQGASSTTFNGGSNDYTVKFIDASNNEKIINVPKVIDSQFTTLNNPTQESLGSAGSLPDATTKLHKFNLGTSLDGITFTDITSEGVTTYVQNPVTLGYEATTKYPIKTIDSPKLYFKLPDADITFLNKVKINMWRAS